MSGKPGGGRGGRKTNYEEIQIGELTKKLVDWAINNWAKLSKTEKIRMLLVLAPKYVVQKIEGTGFDTDIFNFITGVRQDFQENSIASLGLDKGNGLDKGRT